MIIMMIVDNIIMASIGIIAVTIIMITKILIMMIKMTILITALSDRGNITAITTRVRNITKNTVLKIMIAKKRNKKTGKIRKHIMSIRMKNIK